MSHIYHRNTYGSTLDSLKHQVAMVLENSSDTTGGDPFNENPPASDDDPYSSSTPQAGPSNYRIDIANLPKPVPIIGPLTGWNDQFFLKVDRKSVV